MPTNADYTREYFEIMDALGGDVAGRRAAFDYMQNSTAIVHHQVVACSFIPRLFNKKTYDTMKETAETAHRILVKVIEHYLADPEYRRAFDFDPRLEELILLPRGYDSVLPFARVDTFLNEDDYRVKFCEFNADGSSGMNENRETPRRWRSRARSRSSRTATMWRAASCSIRGCRPSSTSMPPTPAAWRTRVSPSATTWRTAWWTSSTSTPTCSASAARSAWWPTRDLRFDGDALYDKDGQRIDAITKHRCVTNDVIDHWDDSQELLNAVRAEKVALIGSFAGHIVNDKQIFKVLFDDRTVEFLDGDEISFIEETVPMTAFLDDDYINVPQIRANKDEWIIKPTDHYGADDVRRLPVSQEEWRASSTSSRTAAPASRSSCSATSARSRPRRCRPTRESTSWPTTRCRTPLRCTTI